MADDHKNFAYSLVATAPSPASSGTSLVVTAGQGTLFPTAPFNATIWPAGVQPLSTNAEIVRVTAISTDTFTITRAQEGTAARTVVVGDQIAATITDKTLTDVETDIANHIADSSAAHAASAISASSTTLSGTATDVQAVFEELDNLLDDHSARHEDGGADEISLTGLSGAPADTVNKTLFDANTVLAADSDNTPAAVTMAASTILARLAAGNIKAASVSEIRTLLGLPAAYQLIFSGRQKFDAQAAFTTTMNEGGAGVAGGTQAGFALFQIDPADYPSGATLRVRILVVTNATAPTSTFTGGLYPTSTYVGGAAALTYTLGTVTSGSTAAVAAPASGSAVTAVSTDFTFPTAGAYALGLVITTNMVANSSALVRVTLEVKF